MAVQRVSEERLKKFSDCGNYGSGCSGSYGYGCGNLYGGYGFGNGNGCGYGESGDDSYSHDGGNRNGGGYGFGSYGSGEGNAGGSGYGGSDGSGIKAVCGAPVLVINEIATAISKIAATGNLAKGYVINEDMSLSKCYVAKYGTCFAHGRTAAEAIKRLKTAWEERRQCT